MRFPGGSDGKESACNVGDSGSIPGWGRSPGEENGYPLQYSCLEIPRTEEPDGLHTVHGISESDMTEGLTLYCTICTGWHVDPHQMCVFTFIHFYSQGSIDSSHVLFPAPDRVDRAGNKSDTNPCPCGADTLVDMPTTVLHHTSCQGASNTGVHMRPRL